MKVLLYYLYYKYRRPFKDREALEKWQEKKLKKHLDYVAAHAAFYSGKREFQDYPIMDKAFLMAHFDTLNTVGIRRAEAEAFALRAERERDFAPKLRGVTVGLSSGTSGRRGIFLVSDGEKNRWAGYILARFLPGSILDSLDIAFFMRADSNLYQAVSSRNIRFHFFDIYRDMEEHKERLERTKPAILAGQPSLLLMLAREREQGNLHISPGTVISIAEVLEREDELYLKKAFCLEVIHQVYQCTEGCLASTCARGTLHLNEDIVRIEREYLDRNRFVPIVTDFQRKAQPIIRYRLNDILVEKESPCGCGSPFLALEKIEGREDDIFVFLDGKGQKKTVFPDFIRRCVLFAEEERDEGAGEKGIESFTEKRIEGSAGKRSEGAAGKGNEVAAVKRDGDSAGKRDEGTAGKENEVAAVKRDGDSAEKRDEGTAGKGNEVAAVKRDEDSAEKCDRNHGRKQDRNHAEYRIEQKRDGSITVYADFGAEEKAQVLAEFQKLAQDREFILPEIRFAPYYRETGKKLKRVERERS